MFTGITQGLCTVSAIQQHPEYLQYTLTFPPTLAHGLAIGQSVAVEGVCQTVMQLDGQQVSFQAIAETLCCTTLNDLQLGQSVSIERSARLGDEVGGHEVSGHVTGTATIIDITAQSQTRTLTLQCPADWMKYLFPKGFIAVDGSSLTLMHIDQTNHTFTVSLIPETLRVTRFAQKNCLDRVNVELDARTISIVDTVEQVLKRQTP